jgi:hypothetical protein
VTRPDPTNDDDRPLTDMERGLVRLLVSALLDEFMKDIMPDDPLDLAALRLLAPPTGDGSVTIRTELYLRLLDELQRLRDLVIPADESPMP